MSNAVFAVCMFMFGAGLGYFGARLPHLRTPHRRQQPAAGDPNRVFECSAAVVPEFQKRGQHFCVPAEVLDLVCHLLAFVPSFWGQAAQDQLRVRSKRVIEPLVWTAEDIPENLLAGQSADALACRLDNLSAWAPGIAVVNLQFAALAAEQPV